MVSVEAVSISHRDSVFTSNGSLCEEWSRRRKRVLLSSTLYFPNIGGVENSIYHLGREYRKRGMRPVLLVSTGGDANATARWFEVRRIHGLPVLRYKFSSIALIRFLRAWMALRVLRRKFRIMSMVARDQHSALAAVMVGQPCVYLVPGIAAEQHRPKGLNPLRWLNHLSSVLLQRTALGRVAEVAVFSRRMAESIAATGVKRDVHRVSPGIDPSRFRPISRSEIIEHRGAMGIAADAVVGVVVGRLARQKRLDLAIEALAVAPKNWWLLIAGDGPLRRDVEGQAERLGVGSRVVFAGSTRFPEKIMQIADIYVLSSDNETFGQVLLEAMACGLKIVAFDPSLSDVDTATDEIVPQDWLFTAGAKDARALQAAMAEAVEATRHPCEISSWAHANYSWQRLAQRLMEFATARR